MREGPWTRVARAYPALRHRPFVLLWTGGVVSAAGDWLLALALPYHVYQHAGSSLATSALFMANVAPRVLLGSVAGVLADRWDRRRAMLAMDLLRACLLVAMLPVAWSDAWLWLAYPLVVAEASASTLFRPAKGALLPRLVPRDELLSANALDAVGDSVLRLTAPLAGGVLLAAFGLASVLVVDAASYLVSAVAVFLLPRGETPAAVGTSGAGARWRAFWTEWLRGLRVVASDPVLRGVFAVAAIANLGGGLFGPLMAPFVEDVLGAGPTLMGGMVTATGLGTLAAGLVLGRLRGSDAALRGAALGQIVLGLALLATFRARDAALVVALSAPAGVGLAAGVGFATALQARAGERERGRVLGAAGTTSALATLLGQGLAGVLPARIGLPAALDAAGAAALAAGVLGMLLWLPRPRASTTCPT